MKTVTWEIKDSWTETKRSYPDKYTDYLFFNGWVKIGKLFPGIKSIYAIGGQLKGSHIYWNNFKPYSFVNTIWKQFFLRIDLGQRFIIITRPDPDCYRNVNLISIKEG